MSEAITLLRTFNIISIVFIQSNSRGIYFPQEITRLIHELIHTTQFLWNGIELGQIVLDAIPSSQFNLITFKICLQSWAEFKREFENR